MNVALMRKIDPGPKLSRRRPYALGDGMSVGRQVDRPRECRRRSSPGRCQTSGSSPGFSVSPGLHRADVQLIDGAGSSEPFGKLAR